ncbi:Josephin domain-containing protein [Orpheovirus IHUMI-LCC2]|uniref:Josephin domain-containing protein n=1 Tax=Orpheovirus IHUMI-LCC2 TaxID=2023057 RepID=A0A2I2L6A4_9VIRU|nr:Josephin domain-containing protein [Orpheovirus IHUMI-LCC2]SNW63064.1 Josephin domain-containing protein [Orpheovirus IHUMI-LCC2]
MSKIYFERQTADSDNCRLCSINNIMGRKGLSIKGFIKHCQEFDKKYKCTGSNQYFIVQPTDNSLSYILNKIGIKSIYYPPNTNIDVNHILENYNAFMVFSDEHVWVCKKIEEIWYTLDSLCKKIVKLRKGSLSRKLGYIIIIK